jgi:hypothetical protein
LRRAIDDERRKPCEICVGVANLDVSPAGDLAKTEGISLNQLITLAVAEKIVRLELVDGDDLNPAVIHPARGKESHWDRCPF